MHSKDDKPRSVGDEVMDYLARHRAAEDTLEGIVSWWLPLQRMSLAVASIEEALRDLVSRNQVAVRRGPDGRLRYRLNPQFTNGTRRRTTRTPKRPTGRPTCR